MKQPTNESEYLVSGDAERGSGQRGGSERGRKDAERLIWLVSPDQDQPAEGYDHLGAEQAPDDDLTDDERAIEAAVREILMRVGEDPERDGLLRTPYRVAKMFRELLGGYAQSLSSVVNGALFDVEYGDGEMVVVADIAYDSLCEHHMLPFTGRIHVGYLPGEKVIGLSKIPRIVEMYARRLQIQERLGNQIADAIVAAVAPAGVFVVVEGTHSCAALRGVKKHDANMVTTAMRGEFRRNPELRAEFYRLIGH